MLQINEQDIIGIYGIVVEVCWAVTYISHVLFCVLVTNRGINFRNRNSIELEAALTKLKVLVCATDSLKLLKVSASIM